MKIYEHDITVTESVNPTEPDGDRITHRVVTEHVVRLFGITVAVWETTNITIR